MKNKKKKQLIFENVLSCEKDNRFYQLMNFLAENATQTFI